MRFQRVLMWGVLWLVAGVALATQQTPTGIPAVLVAQSYGAQSVPAAQAPGARAVSALLPLQEFRTAGNAGWFYTLSQSEATSAATQYGFTRQGTVGQLNPDAGPGTQPLYRLRATASSSYLVTGSTTERDKLVQSGQFVNEGVLGYIDTAQQADTVHLMRFSNHGQWRLAPESQTAEQQAAGYTIDGPVGWILPESTFTRRPR
ncbi:MAG: hypothetical protein ACRDQU_09580 [Pseudonocardiaceae bacterium]